MCVCVCVCIYTPIYTYIYVCVCVYFKMRTFIGLPAFVSPNKHIKKTATTTTVYCHHPFLKEKHMMPQMYEGHNVESTTVL